MADDEKLTLVGVIPGPVTKCPPGPCKKPSKNRMSASFAYALDKMEEKYIKIQFIEIKDESGTLPEEELKRLIASRANCIIHDEKIFELTTIEKPYYHYINTTTTKVDPIVAIMSEYIVNVETGQYRYVEIVTGGAHDIEVLQQEIDEIQQNLDEGKVPALPKYILIEEDAETGEITVSLLNYLGEVLSTQTINLTKKLIKSAEFDNVTKTIKFTCLDGSTIDADISEVISDYETKIAQLKTYTDNKVTILQNNIDASGHSITSVFENDILTTTLKDANGNVLSTTTVEIDTGDKYIVSGEYDTNTKSIILHYNDETTVSISLVPLINSLPTKQDITDLQNALAQEVTTRENVDTDLSNRLDIIEDDYLTSADKTDLENQISTVQGNLNTEISDRQTADTNLQNALNQEATTRASADNTLQSNIDTESTARQSADEVLASDITNEATTREQADNALSSRISTIEEDYLTSADKSDLESQISTVQDNLTTEISNRQTADNTLQGNINAEATARQTADEKLSSDILAETTAREEADTNLSNNISAVQDNLDTEISDRQTADTNLQNAIDSEASTRQTTDTTLSNRITAIENKGYITQDINTSSISVQYTKSKSKTTLVTEGTWNTNTLPSNELPLSSAYGNSYYICCGYNGVIMYSQDAIEWTLFAPKFTNEKFDKICYGNGYFLLMCYDTGHIYKAYNPNIWSLLTTIENETITNLQYINNKFVLTGANGYLAYSDTGESFNKVTLSVNETVRAIAYGNSAYVLVGNNGLVMTSRDGVTWYNRTDNNFNQDYKGILFERGIFVVYTDTLIKYSPNYYSFINATIPTMDNYTIQQIICGESTFYAISTDNTNTIVLNSSDGKTFSSIYTINQGIYTECYGNDNLVLTNSSAYDLDLEIHWSYNKPSLADDEYLWGRSANHLNNGDVLYSAAYYIFTPKTLSEFKNDMGFIDKDADDLTNYYDIPTTDDLLDDKQDDMDEITNAEINLLFS